MGVIKQCWRRRSVRLLSYLLLGCTIALLATAWQRSALQVPEASYLLYDRHGSFLAEVGNDDEQGYGYWAIDKLPERVVAATLAIEDRRFWSHPGVDPIAVARAIWQNLSSSQRVSGASTLAMQVARMQAPAGRNYFNKAIEATTAMVMTARHGRHELLAHYLRLVPYGNNIHGIAYAARRYLDKPVADLSWAEIAFLSAIPQSPSRMNPFDYDGRQRAVARGERILQRLHTQAVIDTDELELAIKQIRAIHMPSRQLRSRYAMHAILKMEDLLKNGALAQKGDYILHTSIDLELQREVTVLTESMLTDAWRAKGAGNAAVIVLDKTSAQVLAWVGAADYFDDRYSGAIDYTQVKRSSGSTLKPFTYALALEQGHITPATVLADIPIAGVPVHNSDSRFLGPLLPRQALANSRNVPAYNLVRELGVEENYAFLKLLGLHDGELPARYYGLGIAIGALSVSLQDLVQAYTALANDGVMKEIHWLDVSNPSRERRVLSSQTARLVTLFLSDPAARLPSFPRMGTTEYDFPVALKTGTSQGYRDAWTVAYSDKYLIGVWTGDPDYQSMSHLGGAGSAADLIQRILTRLHKDQSDGLHDLGFPAPSGYQRVSLCSHSGKLASDRCEQSYPEWLSPAAIPQQYDESNYPVVVDRRTGEMADELTPPEERELHRVLNLPLRYVAWSQQSSVASMPVAFNKDDTRGVVELVIQSPADGARFMPNPELPDSMNTIELSVVPSRAIPQVVWYVDNQPYRVSAFPYTVRWQLERGEHVIQARVSLTDERSQRVRIVVE